MNVNISQVIITVPRGIQVGGRLREGKGEGRLAAPALMLDLPSKFILAQGEAAGQEVKSSSCR